MAKKKDEISQILKKVIDDTAEELQNILPDFDMTKPIPDEKIKQAILDLELEPQRKIFLYQRFGQQQVDEFLREFSQGRRW